MRNHIIRRTTVVLATVAATAVGVSAASAGETPDAPQSVETPQAVETQTGVVLEGTATLDGRPVTLSVYDNSLHGSSANVVIGDPEEGGSFGYGEQQTAYVVAGQLSAIVEIDGEPATLTGTLVESGRPTRIRESFQDAGEQLVTKGTNTPLLADVTLSYDGETVPVEVGVAFAYDLQVRAVDLYGN